MTQTHQANLVGSLFNGSTLLSDRQASLAQSLTGSSGGYALSQAQTMAYNDAFLMIGVVFVFPALFLLKKPAAGASPPGGAMWQCPTQPARSDAPAAR